MARENKVMVRLSDEELRRLKKMCKKTFGDWDGYYSAYIRLLLGRAK